MNSTLSIAPAPRLDNPEMTLSLDGQWQVRKWPFDCAQEESLAQPTVDDSAWEKYSQPGKVFYADPEAEGRDTPNWNRVTLSHIDPNDGAIMRRRITIPIAWKANRILLRFDAVFPAGRFYFNGHCLGEHLSGLTPVQFDITNLATPGDEAVVAVRLIRRHKFVQMDMVRHALEFGGLAQSACLYAVAPCHIADYHLIPTLTDGFRQGTIAGNITVANTTTTAVEAQLTVTITDAQDVEVAAFADTTTIPAAAREEVPVTVAVDQPALWNDEFPNLYTVTVALNVAGQPEQTVQYRIGFRQFELRPQGARLNGRPVKFRGVNHLTFHPEHGMHTPEEWLCQNLTLMKRANVNAIRTHFLAPHALADLCDELGIYLLQELPVDWGTDYIHDPEWLAPALLRIEGGIRRDRHHPSVMVWSIGNENMPNAPEVATAGWNHLRQFEALAKRLDPSRPTMFPPPGPANAIDGIIELRVGDIADTHYSFNHIRKFLAEGAVENPNSWKADMLRTTREEALDRGWSGVWFSSEYGIFNAMPDLLYHPHCSIISDVPEDALSGKCTMQAFEERLRREWGFMRHEPSCLGGAYFPWLCCGVGSAAAGNPWGWVRWGEDADWGVVTADLLPKPFFWALRVLFSPVWFPTRLTWKKGDSQLRFKILNQYNAIDLKDCTLRVQQNGGGRYATMMRKFQDIPISGAPGAETDLCIPLNEGVVKSLNNDSYALVRCTLLNPQGFRPVTAEIIVTPEDAAITEVDATMPVGPDAVL